MPGLHLLPTESARISLVGHTLIVVDGDLKSRHELIDGAQLLETYRDLFGIDIQTAPVNPESTGVPAD
ncbi:hypothetical protein [Mycobacteroides sp. LB1]|uniref:hypothetical protein n=1 Tax=Mycobacteroides sp. LB1 TaxID=2750814 RepID=UPI0015DD7858|nr:hypothetical protein [Mycobacteroides sp. LB1]